MSFFEMFKLIVEMIGNFSINSVSFILLTKSYNFFKKIIFKIIGGFFKNRVYKYMATQFFLDNVFLGLLMILGRKLKHIWVHKLILYLNWIRTISSQFHFNNSRASKYVSLKSTMSILSLSHFYIFFQFLA